MIFPYVILQTDRTYGAFVVFPYSFSNRSHLRYFKPYVNVIFRVRKVLNSFVSLIVPALTESSGIDFLWKCSINFPEPRSGGLLVVKVINSLREPRSGGLFVKNTYFYSSGFK